MISSETPLEVQYAKNSYSTERCSWHGIWSALQFHHCILAAKIYAGMKERSSSITEVVFLRAQITNCSDTETWWPQACKNNIQKFKEDPKITKRASCPMVCVLGLVFRVCARANYVGACFLCSFPVCIRKFRRIICKVYGNAHGVLFLHEGHRAAICIYVSIWCLLVIRFHLGRNIAYVCCSWQRSKCFSININYKS